MNKTELCIKYYKKFKNLKLVEKETGMPWQTVYYHLKKSGVEVSGNKTKYGSDKDKLAAKGEEIFEKIVPFAENINKIYFQPKCDFIVKKYLVDVKTSKMRKAYKYSKNFRWAFYVKKQEIFADYIVCIGFLKKGYRIFLLPKEVFNFYRTISITVNGKGKWYDYLIKPRQLKMFFKKI